MKYIKEAKEIFEIMFKEEWMDEDDFNEIEDVLLKEMKTDYVALSNLIEDGVKKGYSVKFQKEIAHKVKKF